MLIYSFEYVCASFLWIIGKATVLHSEIHILHKIWLFSNKLHISQCVYTVWHVNALLLHQKAGTEHRWQSYTTDEVMFWSVGVYQTAEQLELTGSREQMIVCGLQDWRLPCLTIKLGRLMEFVLFCHLSRGDLLTHLFSFRVALQWQR